MVIKFKEKALADLYKNGKTNDSKYKKLCKNKRLIEGYQRAVSIMYGVETAEELKLFSFFALRKIKVHERTLKFCTNCKRNG